MQFLVKKKHKKQKVMLKTLLRKNNYFKKDTFLLIP
jgi:hypothetical protein